MSEPLHIKVDDCDWYIKKSAIRGITVKRYDFHLPGQSDVCVIFDGGFSDTITMAKDGHVDALLAALREEV